MTWFKENKFLGGLLVVTLILAVLLLAFGISQKGKKDDLLAEVEQTKSDLKGKRSMDPFPTPANVKEKKANLKEVIAAATELQTALVAYAPPALTNIPVGEFSSRLETASNSIVSLYGEKIFLPEDFLMGFESYRGEAPNAKATGVLSYQLEAFEWMFREFAAAGIEQIDNVYRTELAPERGEDWGGPKPSPKKKKKSKSKKKKAAKRGPVGPKVARSLPFEVTITGKEASVRDALSRVANGEKYFVAARAVRIKNSGGIPNNKRLSLGRDDEENEPEEEEVDAGGLFDNEDAPAEATASDDDDDSEDAGSGRILESVAGTETITAILRADLLLFETDPKFPTIK